MRVCSNISQIGMPVVPHGCDMSEQFEVLTQAQNITDTKNSTQFMVVE